MATEMIGLFISGLGINFLGGLLTLLWIAYPVIICVFIYRSKKNAAQGLETASIREAARPLKVGIGLVALQFVLQLIGYLANISTHVPT